MPNPFSLAGKPQDIQARLNIMALLEALSWEKCKARVPEPDTPAYRWQSTPSGLILITTLGQPVAQSPEWWGIFYHWRRN